MKLWSAIAIAVILSATLLYGRGSPQTGPEAAAPSTRPSASRGPPPARALSAQGRYQISTIVTHTTAGDQDVTWMVDTQTGDIWRFQVTTWVYMGNPTMDPGLQK